MARTCHRIFTAVVNELHIRLHGYDLILINTPKGVHTKKFGFMDDVVVYVE